MKNKILTFNGSKINYKIYGTGKPVMLIHGFGEDSSIWDGQVKYLQESFQLIIPDLPGTGKSTLIEKENVQISDYAEAMKAILDEEQVEHCIMIGHSMGGYISLAFANKYPHMLNALGPVHSGAYADDEDKIAVRKKGIKFIRESGAAAFLKTSIPGLFSDPEKNKIAVDGLLEKGNGFSSEALIQYYEAMIARPDTTAVLKTLPVPVLFIIGEHDKAIPFAHSLQQTHMPSVAHVHILRNSAHMGMLEEEEKFSKYLGEFLQTL